MLHMLKTQPRNHKEMGTRTSTTSLCQNQYTKQEERNPVSGVRKMFILTISASPRIQHVISVVNKDTVNEPVFKKKWQDKGKKSKNQN